MLRMKLLGANRHPASAGTDALAGKSNYFAGNDPSKWRTNVPTYAKVNYRGVYPGIDLVYYGNQRLLEYDFLVAAGADPRAIKIRLQGAKKLSVNHDGTLVLDMGAGEVIEQTLAVYQETGGQRWPVAASYILYGKDRVGFRVARYDRSRPLVIDPTVMYSATLSQGALKKVAVDASGNAYVTGTTSSGQVFVEKLNAAGTAVVYSTYLGQGLAEGIAVDAASNAYIVGETASANFPTTSGAFQTAHPPVAYPGARDGFVAKLSPTGSLIYSTYLGTPGEEIASGIAVNASGQAFVTGVTDYPWAYPDFPVTPGAFQSWDGAMSVFVSKLKADGSGLVYSSRFGSIVQGVAIAVDTWGNAYVTGFGAGHVPTTPGAFRSTPSSDYLFVSKLNPAGSALVYSTYLGAGLPFGIAVDGAGSAYVAGTGSGDFPTTPGAFQPTSGGAAFVSKLNATGSALAYSTFLGGGYPYGFAFSIAVDGAGNAYVTGVAGDNFPVTPNALVPGGPGAFPDGNGFLTKLNANGSSLVYSSYSGTGFWTTGGAYCPGIAVDRAGSVYLACNVFDDLRANSSISKYNLVPADVNGDGNIDCADISIVKAALGRRAGSTGWDGRGDVNLDGSIDVRDLALVAQKLPTGTKCP